MHFVLSKTDIEAECAKADSFHKLEEGSSGSNLKGKNVVPVVSDVKLITIFATILTLSLLLIVWYFYALKTKLIVNTTVTASNKLILN